MRPVYLNVLIVEVQVTPDVTTNGPSHLTQVTSILLVRFVTGLPMLNVQLFVTKTFLNTNAVRTPTVTSVMEDIAPFTSNVSTLSHVNEDEDTALTWSLTKLRALLVLIIILIRSVNQVILFDLDSVISRFIVTRNN